MFFFFFEFSFVVVDTLFNFLAHNLASWACSCNQLTISTLPVSLFQRVVIEKKNIYIYICNFNEKERKKLIQRFT